jgi:hypothetical protein
MRAASSGGGPQNCMINSSMLSGLKKMAIFAQPLEKV